MIFQVVGWFLAEFWDSKVEGIQRYSKALGSHTELLKNGKIFKSASFFPALCVPAREGGKQAQGGVFCP